MDIIKIIKANIQDFNNPDRLIEYINDINNLDTNEVIDDEDLYQDLSRALILYQDTINETTNLHNNKN